MIKQIVATDSNFAIGNNNKLLFPNKTDMSHFKKLTMGDNPDVENVVLMGRKTYQSLPIPKLEGRYNIVLTSNPFAFESFYKVSALSSLNKTLVSYKELEAEGKANFDLWIIGGGEIYRESLEYTDEIYLTLYPFERAEEADTYYPIDDVYALFKEDETYKHTKLDEGSGLLMDFLKFIKK